MKLINEDMPEHAAFGGLVILGYIFLNRQCVARNQMVVLVSSGSFYTIIGSTTHELKSLEDLSKI